jgi:hypothetical protein
VGFVSSTELDGLPEQIEKVLIMNIALTKISSNKKVGKMPVTTSGRETCPDSCPLINDGCYASAGYYTRLHWDKVTSGERGTSFADFIEKIKAIKPGTVWRHNVAGDLQGDDDLIDIPKLIDLTLANTGKRGFTYTHYPMNSYHNRKAVYGANNHGFTVNVSANSPNEAIELKENYTLPVVSIVPSDYWTDGNKVGDIVRCPAEYKETDCKACQLCAHGDRAVIVGFSVHGAQSKSANIIARG